MNDESCGEIKICRICITNSSQTVMVSIFNESELWKQIKSFADVEVSATIHKTIVLYFTTSTKPLTINNKGHSIQLYNYTLHFFILIFFVCFNTVLKKCLFICCLDS